MATFHKDEMHIALAEGTAALRSTRQISFGDGEVFPALSPDEKKIAYVDWSRGGGIKIVNIDGGEPRVIQATTYFEMLAWAPDGAGLVYSGRDDLWTVRLDEGKPRSIAAGAGRKYYPSYTADGRFIVFQRIQENKDDIWKVPVEGGQVQALVTSGMFPRAAPVGTRVAYFQHPTPDEWELHTLDTSNGKDQVMVTGASLAPYHPYT